MIKEKHKILNKSGVSVTLTNIEGTIIETKALVGRASKQFNSTLALEHYRRGHFLPSIGIKSGLICHSIPANEDYILVATYPDIIEGEVCTDVSHMMICNSSISISSEQLEGDSRGNLTTDFVEVYSDIKVHAQAVTQELRQYDPGIYPDTQYILYAPLIEIDPLSKVTLKVLEKQVDLKVISSDYLSFPGCVLLQVKTETR